MELERSAGRAQARGGFSAAGAFLQRSVALTLEPTRRADRALAAAQASLRAGAFEAELSACLPQRRRPRPLDEFQRARVDLLRGQIDVRVGYGAATRPRLLLHAAKRLEQFDLDLARETYLNALGAQRSSSAPTRVPRGICVQVSRARRRAAPAPAHPPRPVDLLLERRLAIHSSRKGEAAARHATSGEQYTAFLQ